MTMMFKHKKSLARHLLLTLFGEEIVEKPPGSAVKAWRGGPELTAEVLAETGRPVNVHDCFRHQRSSTKPQH